MTSPSPGEDARAPGEDAGKGDELPRACRNLAEAVRGVLDCDGGTRASIDALTVALHWYGLALVARVRDVPSGKGK
jgi:hypothetical protein